MSTPGIKGTLFAAVVEDLNQLLAGGGIEPAELEARLSREELALLEAKINPLGWYDIHSYHHMVALLCDSQDGDHDQYWEERGRRAARRLAEAGIYQQMDYLGRTLSKNESDPAARFRALGKDLRLLLTLQQAMLNFGAWKCTVDPDHGDRYRVEITGISGVPDGIFMAATGTFNEMSLLARGTRSLRWEFERAGPDLAYIRMACPA